MKKLLSIVLMLVMLAVVLVPAAAAGDTWELSVVVNGEFLSFPDAQPFVDANNRTQVPVRFVSEALSAKVEWVQETQSVIITKGSKEIILTIGKNEMMVNGVVKNQDSAPVLVENRTFVPLRFVSEALSAKVEWEQETRTVFITLAEGVEYIVSDEIEANGFIISVESGDDATLYKGRARIVKESGLKITESDPRMGLISLVMERSGDVDYAEEMNQVKAILSQKISVDKVAEVIEEVKKYEGNKEKESTFIIIEDGVYIISIAVSADFLSIKVEISGTSELESDDTIYAEEEWGGA